MTKLSIHKIIIIQN